jgi:exonuclease SbcC
MRPVRLEVEGFTAFRDRTVVEFGGAELFALTGPTGSGKSSLIDAMTFALYGVVARYDDRRLVAPVITQGSLEARVRFDFDLAGRRYSAARVVRVTGRGGATTKEARLERHPDEVLAADARSVTAEVETLLGLGFEHFTTCVVLPQGEFDHFLHEERAEREKLLERLLALRQFRDMAGLARSRAQADQARLAVVDAQQAEIAERGPDRAPALEIRLARLTKVGERIDEARPVLERLRADAGEAREEVARLEARQVALAEIAVPDDVVVAAGRLEAADRELFLQGNQTEAAVTLREELEERAGELEERDQLRQVAERWTRHDELTERVAKGATVVAEAVEDGEAARSAHAAAGDERLEAAEAVEQTRRDDRAQDLRSHLVTGEPCPVCLQEVRRLPEHTPSEAVTEAVSELTTATRALEVADRRRAEAERATGTAEALLTQLTGELEEATATLEGAPSSEAASRRRAELDRLTDDLAGARRAAAEAETEFRRAQQRRSDLAERQGSLRRSFDAARAPLADLGPPPPGHVDLADDWRTLAAWAEEHRPEVDGAIAAALTRADDADRERALIDERITATCAEMGLDVVDDVPGEVVAAARASAGIELEQARRDAVRATLLDSERVELAASHRVADTLGQHLSAGRFTTWMLDEALARLVLGATEILRELSAGAYSLTMDEGGSHFAVIDHTNADAVRSARTLSGGETFLASLALALALAEQVAELAGDGAAPLESVFLDEGFGALDLDTLDIVADALEELGASGRTVGVVTHVRDLADRMPVRFEVRKDAHTATVERIER